MLVKGNCLLGASCFAAENFDNFANGVANNTAFIIFIVVVAVLLAVATHRLVPSNKLLHVFLTLLFGAGWVVLVWLYYAFFTSKRLR